MRYILFFFLVINPISWLIAYYDAKKNSGGYWNILDWKFKLAMCSNVLWSYAKI